MTAIRICDFVLALGLIVVLGLPMFVIAIAIRLMDSGPALFVQTRIGLGGRPFQIYKFRTMRPAPSAVRDRGAVSTSAGDARITAIGSKLRPAHLDELPQLINILKGDMSFVGVRPDTPLQEADYPPGYWEERHRDRPGLTGPAQLLRGEVDLERRIAAERKWLGNSTLSAYWRFIGSTAAKVLARTSH